MKGVVTSSVVERFRPSLLPLQKSQIKKKYKDKINVTSIRHETRALKAEMAKSAEYILVRRV